MKPMPKIFDITIGKPCPACGAALDENGDCPACRQRGGRPAGQWTVCQPPSAATDCDCPVIGYAKLHAPWCKYS